MLDYENKINTQYGRERLADQILAALRAAGKNLDALTRADLSTFDEFHVGGVAETRSLAQRVGCLQPGTRVLDVGSGLGGPARTLAAEFGCQVTGLDLTDEFCEAATELTRLVGLTGQVSFHIGNAMDMPFEAGTFDVVWSQFAGMNIPDKQRFYAECRRVLRSGGYLAFHEIMNGSGASLHFPVFWADSDSINYLKPPQEIRQTLAANGLEEIAWIDLTRDSSEWFRRIAVSQAENGTPPLGFNIFVGKDTPQKAANVLRNLDEGRIVVVQGIYRVRP
ncbi:MAG: methyltransferase domain-containing protein [Chloroflexi bacterium]|nr:methyltransferase domain-containing protein [Chloroflexota bacterium]